MNPNEYKEYSPRKITEIGIVSDIGDTVPSDGSVGYAKSCVFQNIAGSGSALTYVNRGTTKSCEFILQGTGGSGFGYSIAPSDASDSIKNASDLVLDGVTDGTTLNVFIQANKAVDVFETYDQIQLELGPGKIFLDVPLVFDGMVVDIRCAGPEVATTIFLAPNANCDHVQIIQTGTPNTRVNVYGGHWNANMLNQGDVIKADIASVTANTIVIVGDVTGTIEVGRPLYIFGSDSELVDKVNDGYYTIVSAVFGGGNTTVTVNEAIPDTSPSDAGYMLQMTKTWNVKSVENVIVDVEGTDVTFGEITIDGEDAEVVLTVDRPVRVTNSTGMANDGMYGVVSVTTDAGDTVIRVLENIADDGLALDGLVTQLPAIFYGSGWYHSQVQGAIFEGALGSGVLITGGEQITFNQCTPKMNTDCGILVAPRDGETVSDIRINDNTVFGYRRSSLAGLMVSSTPSGRLTNKLWVQNNTIEDCFRYGILVTGRLEDFNITENHFEDGSWAVAGQDAHIRIEGKKDTTGSRRGMITGNTFDTDGSYEGKTATAKSCVDLYNSNDSVSFPDGVITKNNSWTGTSPFLTKDAVDSTDPSNLNGIEGDTVEVAYTDVAANDVDFYGAAVDISGADVNIYPDETEQTKYPRCVTYTPTDASGVDLLVKLEIYWMDDKGVLGVTVTPNVAGGTTYVSDNAFYYIYRIKVRPTNGASSDVVNIGFGSKFLLPGIMEKNLADDLDAVVSVKKNAVYTNTPQDAVKTYNPDVDNNTIDFATNSDDSAGTAINANDDFVVRYKTTSNILVD